MGLLDQGFDPRTQGLLAAAFKGLEASGPSRLPMGLGQIIGQAGTAGLNEYQQAMLMAQKKKQAEALMALEQQKAAMEKIKMDRALKEQAAIEAFQKQVAGGAFTQSPAQQALAGGGGPTPENAGLMAGLKPKLDRQAMLLGAAGTPGLMKEGLSGLMAMDENALKRDAVRQELDMRLTDAKAARDQKSVDRLEELKTQWGFRKEIAADNLAGRMDMGRIAASLRQPPAPIVQTDEKGNTKIYDRSGNLIKDLGATGKASAAHSKAIAAKQKMATDINFAVEQLEKATTDGGLIDKSTGSGAGALADAAAGFFGKATPGAIAVGQMQPIYDLVLKMVPRFEGPQSDKDVKSYRDAAGNLANPATPNAQKKAAAKEILRLMKARKDQFVSKDIIGTEADAPTSGGVTFLGFE